MRTGPGAGSGTWRLLPFVVPVNDSPDQELTFCAVTNDCLRYFVQSSVREGVVLVTRGGGGSNLCPRSCSTGRLSLLCHGLVDARHRDRFRRVYNLFPFAFGSNVDVVKFHPDSLQRRPHHGIDRCLVLFPPGSGRRDARQGEEEFYDGVTGVCYTLWLGLEPLEGAHVFPVAMPGFTHQRFACQLAVDEALSLHRTRVCEVCHANSVGGCWPLLRVLLAIRVRLFALHHLGHACVVEAGNHPRLAILTGDFV